MDNRIGELERTVTEADRVGGEANTTIAGLNIQLSKVSGRTASLGPRS